MAAHKPNIIHLTFDSGRPDHMGVGGYGRETTPFLDDFARRRAAWYAHAFAPGPGSPLSFAGMFTSTLPLDYGGYGYLDRPRVLYPEELQKAGYYTIGIHSSPYLSSYFGYDKGWNDFRYLNYFKPSGSAAPMSPGLRKGTAKAQVLKKASTSYGWLRKHAPPLATVFLILERLLRVARKLVKDALHFRPPFFTAEKVNAEILKAIDAAPKDQPIHLWAHYLDAHAPYGLFYRNGRGLMNKLRYHLSDLVMFLFADVPSVNRFFIPLHIRVYDDSLKFMDTNIRELFDELTKRGIYKEDTMVVIHSDHGDEFLDHGGFGHGQRLWNEYIHVPLILRAPGRLNAPAVVRTPVSLIDVAPTVLEFAGANAPETYRGHSLFELTERDIVVQSSESAGDLSGARFTGISLISEGYKLTRCRNEKLLFAFEDIKELKNIYEEKPDIVKKLEEKVLPYVPGEYESDVPGWPVK